MFRASPSIRRAALLLLLPLPLAVNAQGASDDDRALAALIERLASRSTEGLEEVPGDRGGTTIDLQGRFQQLPIARLGTDGDVMVGCVASVEAASAFLGRDLRSGKSLPAAERMPPGDDLATRAARHGLTPLQMRTYESMIAQAAAAPSPDAATINIINADGAGEGFNDPAPRAAEGGNSGTTLGQQRLNLFNQAAAIWAAFLDSSVPIQINAQFNPLTPCSSLGGVLGSAGAATIHRNFANAEFADTFYHAALASKRAGSDVSTANPDINTRFNSSVDTGCLGAGTRFYYGLDNATPAGTVNLLVVLLHELGHGLGSSSFTASSGAYNGGFPDIWSRYMFDRSVGLTWFQMTQAQRAASAINTDNLLWDGPNVRIASGSLTAARDASGRVELYTPDPFEGGSSVSHWNTTATPNLLMEPFINSGLPLTLDLTRQQMRDIGWYRDTTADLVPDTITGVTPSAGSLNVGQAATITWTNTGSFARNVTIELSTDGGATFPTVIASDVTNTGSRAWTVPNTPTTQGRIRVREHDFVAPAGVSAANFSIGSNTAPTFTPAAALSRQQGSASGAAVTVGTVSDAQTAVGSLAVSQVAGGSATGVTVGGVTNTSGTVSATVAASCSAATGTVRFQVSDGSLTGTGDLQVNVTANTAPTLTYAAQSGNVGANLTVNPSTGPTDNGSVASTTLVSRGTFTGTVSVGSTNGVVNLSNLQPSGTHTITVRATDNCGATTDASFQVTVNVVNTAPTFTPAGALSRQQGSAAGTAVTVGTVTDAQTAAGSLTVTQIAGGSATGIAVGGLTNTSGTVSATVGAACSAATGTVRFQVSDGSLTGTGDLQVNVTANTAPTLTYTAQSGNVGANLTVNPATGPTDNGSVASTTLLSQGTFTGTVSVGSTNGVVNLSNLQPSGTHTITVRATDNCGATTDASFQVTVNVVNTAPTFTTAGALSRQQGSAAGAAVTVGTVADGQTAAGSLTVTQIAGGSAAGISVGSLTNTSGTVSAAVAASCTAATGTVRFQVSDGSLTGTGDLQVNVTANTAPTLAYTVQSGNVGANLTVNPASGPTDNGSIASTTLLSQGTFTGTVSVGGTNGVVTLSNLQPAGTHTITVRATDNCGATTDAAFQVTVSTVNTAPTFTAAGAITRQQGSPAGAAVTVGTVADGQTTAGSLSVTQVAGGTATGVSVGSLANSSGTVGATIAASCSAATGTLRFQVSDGSLTGTGDFQVNVSANTAPTLTYVAQSGDAGTSLTVNPASGPTDNGTIASTTLLGQGTFTGTVSVGATDGIVSLSNLQPAGTHTVTVRATDDCGATTDVPIQVTVTPVVDAMFADGFEPASAG